MKKNLLALLLTLVLALSLSACGGQNAANTDKSADTAAETSDTAEPADEPADADSAATEDPDIAYVLGKGSLIVGITEFEPMDFQDADGNWVGFDADMARAFADNLGVEAVFQIVDWDNKVFELEGQTIDVVWNGMTLTDEVLASMECSAPYFNNAQVVITRSADEVDADDLANLNGLTFAVESGSAGKAEADAHGFTSMEVADQATALLEVSSGTADAAIVDFLMAKAMTGEGTSYEDLTYTVSLNSEEYGVGFRKGSGLAAALNEFFRASYADGSMRAIAEKYNIEEMLIPQ